MKRTFLNRRLRTRGVTLIELVIVVAIIGFLMTAITYAFTGALSLERRQQQRAQTEAGTKHFEGYMTRLLEGAFLSEDTTDTTTYFIAQSDSGSDGISTLGGAKSSGGAQSSQSSGLTTGGSDRITFTSVAPAVPLVSLESTDDFETQHDAEGPVGGVSEVSFGTTPIGEAGGRTGLFERLQHPSDGDATQGGTEGLLASDVTQISFEFYDGTEWITTWDTSATGTTGRHLPQAVRITYTRQGDAPDTQHQFIVPILASDVNAQSPLTQGGA